MRYTPITILALATLTCIACASIGNPDGGRYDEEPPVVVQCFPKDRSVKNDKKKLSILFNEYVKLENENKSYQSQMDELNGKLNFIMQHIDEDIGLS